MIPRNALSCMMLALAFGGLPVRAAVPQWISVAEVRGASPEEKQDELAPKGTSRFFRSVRNAKDVLKAVYEASGLGVFELYVNGKRIGDEVLKPGFTHARKTKYSFSYDVTPLVVRHAGGENLFSARVSTGWWSDKVAGYLGEKSALWARITVAYTDGSSETIVSDAEWQGDTADPVVRAGIFDGEVYDARRAGVGRDGAKPVAVNDEFKGEIFPCNRAPVVLREDLALLPVSAYVWKGVSGASDEAFGTVVKMRSYEEGFAGGSIALAPGETLVVDFGQNAAAMPRFAARAATGTELAILPAEMLNDGNGLKKRGNDGPEGSVYRANLRKIHEKGARIDYTFATDGEETYRPTFTFFGYRFVSVTATGPVEFRKFESVPVTSVMKNMERGSIVTGRADVNRLVSNIKWGMYSNYLSVPTDCPQRNERQGWTADTQVFAEAGCYLADTYDFFRKFMRDMRDTQVACGSYTGVAPPGEYGHCGVQRFGWADCGVIVPYVAWRQTGRLDMLAEHWDSMVAFMDWLKDNRYAKDRALDFQWADWLSCEDYEGCSNGIWDNGKIRPEARVYWKYLGACYWLMDARMMADMARALGKEAESAAYADMAEEALAYIRRDILEDGRIPAILRKMQTPALFALHCGILPGADAVEETKAALLKNIRDHGDCLQTGFLGTSILMDTLTEIGATDVAYTLLLQHRNPSWLYSVDQGATTVWERWNSYRKDAGFGDVAMNSFNHYAYGSVLAWLFKVAAGIQAGERAGFDDEFVLAPIPDPRLKSVDARYRTDKGVIRSAWSYDAEGRCRWSFTVQPGAKATVKANGCAKVFGPGEYNIDLSAHKPPTTKNHP
jgi:alpha-L-rhamnosidase